MLISFRRKVFALSIVIAFCLLVVHLSFQPFSADRVRDFVSGNPYADNLVGNLLLPSATIKSSPSKETIEASASEEEEEEEQQKQEDQQEEALSTVQPTPTPIPHVENIPEKILVVAKIKAANTTWIEDELSDWPTAIYTVDDQNAPLHTSRNKGHEASVYLTYIIDHYDILPPIILFLHSHRNHKHGTRKPHPFDYDNVFAIKNLNLTFVKNNGYASLRCLTLPGCPAELLPFRPDEERDPLRPQEKAMIHAWAELFGNDDVPKVIATPCCAQFAVSRDQVLKRSKAEYERFLDWLYNTQLNDFTSGRIFEYLWHVIFGKDPVYCPDQEQCYWDQFSMVVPPDLTDVGNSTWSAAPILTSPAALSTSLKLESEATSSTELTSASTIASNIESSPASTSPSCKSIEF